MSDHYYSKKPHSQLQTETIKCTLRDRPLTFTTGSGVFSKKAIDFGTRLLIESFTEPAVEGPFLDLGCGYGPIGIALASVYDERTVSMVDINERAVYLSNENIQRNEVENARAFVSEGFAEVDEEQFAAIITNPPIRTGKKVLYPLIEKSAEHLRSDGEFWAVVQKKQGAPSFIKLLETLFREVHVVERSKGYYILRAVKR